MRWPVFTGTLLLLGSVGATCADGPYRRFTQPPIDPNRNNRMIYAPVVSAFSGARSAELPHAVAAAAWYNVTTGSQGTKADKVIDGGRYTLERLGEPSRGGSGAVEVVIARYPAPAADWDVPVLRVVDAASGISSSATAVTEPLVGGVRYRFQVPGPLRRFAAISDAPDQLRAPRYQLEFLPEGGVKEPVALRRAGTFGGASVEMRMTQGPPQLPVAERVAGKRLEFRSARSAGRVVYDEKVAGKRQELRTR